MLLGHDFDTDLLLLRLKIAAPLITDTVNPGDLRRAVIDNWIWILRNLVLDSGSSHLFKTMLACLMSSCMTRFREVQGTQKWPQGTCRKFLMTRLNCWNIHPVATVYGVHNHLGLNEYLLRSDLPGAHLRVQELFQ